MYSHSNWFHYILTTTIMEGNVETNSWLSELDLNERKPSKLSLKVMIKRHLPPDAENWDQDRIITALNQITHLRLDRENINQIDNLELLGPSVTNIYLQRNSIERIENLSFLPNLVFLMLAGNKIQVVENLTCLPKLALLDLSENLIEIFDVDEFPQSLVILNLKDNPCTSLPDHRGSIIQELPCLQQLNEIEITRDERIEAGYSVSSEDEDENEEVNPTCLEPHSTVIDDTKKGLGEITTNMLMRSQERIEDLMEVHKKRTEDMEAMRTMYRFQPCSARVSVTSDREGSH